MNSTTETQPRALALAENQTRAERRTDILNTAIILTCGGAFRLVYQLAYKPFWSLDSIQYTDIFHFWYIRTFSTSERPPVYSLFLGLMQRLSHEIPVESGMGVASQYLTAHVQSVLGLAVALLVYFALRALSVRPRLALAGGLSVALLGAVCIFELFILTELLSLFLLTLGIYFFVHSMRAVDGSQPFSASASASGLSFGFAILTRPENLVFCAVIILVVLALAARCYRLPEFRFASPRLTRLAILLLVSAAPVVLCWMTWNLLSIGQFRINTLNGVTRTESTYNMFDRVSSEDRVA